MKMTIPKTFKVPLPTRDSYSTQYKVPRFHLSPYHKWHLDQLSCFWRAHGCVQQTHTHTHTEKPCYISNDRLQPYNSRELRLQIVHISEILVVSHSHGIIVWAFRDNLQSTHSHNFSGSQHGQKQLPWRSLDHEVQHPCTYNTLL